MTDVSTPVHSAQVDPLASHDALPDMGLVVDIENFSGPLDLLLFLVRRTELDILDIPLGTIIDQFVAAVASWQDMDLDVAGDFILMAATLLEIKARTIAPQTDQEVGAEEDDLFDPRANLISSLLTYRRFKEATALLGACEAQRAACVNRQLREIIPEEPAEDSDHDLGDLEPHLLMSTFELILARINGLGPRTVMVDDMPMSVRIQQMLDHLRQGNVTSMQALLGPRPNRLLVSATMMALLECTRQRLLEIRQDEQYGTVAVRLRTGDEAVVSADETPEEAEHSGRRQRRALITYAAPEGQALSTQVALSEDTQLSDEQRFLIELEDASRVDVLLARAADLEGSFTAYLAERHPEVLALLAKPAPVAAVAAPAVVVAPVVACAEPAPLKPRRAARAPSDSPPAAVAPESVSTSTSAAAPPETTGDAVVETSAPDTALTTAAPGLPADPPSYHALGGPLPIEPAEPAMLPTASAHTVVAPDDPTLVSSAMLDPATAVADSTPAARVAQAESQAPSPDEPATANPDPLRDVLSREAPSQASEHDRTPAPLLSEPEASDLLAQPRGHEHDSDQDEDSEEEKKEEEEEEEQASDDIAVVNAILLGQDQPKSRHAITTAPADPPADSWSAQDRATDDVLSDDPHLISQLLDEAAHAPEESTVPSSHRAVLAPEPSVTTSDQHAALVRNPPSPLVDTTQTAHSDPTALPPGSTSATRDGQTSPTDPDEHLETGAPAAEAAPPALDSTYVPDEAGTSESALDAAASLPLALSGSPLDLPPTHAPQDTLQSPAMPAPVAAAEPAPIEADAVPAQHDDSVTPAATVPKHDVLAPCLPTGDGGNLVAPIFQFDVNSGDQPFQVLTPNPESPATACIVAEGQDATASDSSIAVIPAEALGAGADQPAPDRIDPLVLSHDIAVAPVSAVPNVDAQHQPDTDAGVLHVAVVDAVAALATDDSVVSTIPGDEPPPTPAPLLMPADVPIQDGGPPPGGPPDPPDRTRPDPAPPLPPDPPPPQERSSITNTTPTILRKKPAQPFPMRPKTLHIIAGLVLINLLWVAYSWMTWVPKDVIEVAEGPTAEMLDQHGVHWRFNLDMVDDQHVGKPPLVPPTMTPAVAGAWTWADRRTLTFTPDKDFPLATAFALHVDAKALRSVNGFVLAHALDAVVRTPALMVTSVTVTSFAADGVADVLLSFNQPVDPDRIAKQLQVTPPVAAVADDAGATAQSGHAAATASAVTTAASAPVIPSSTPGPTQLPLHAATRPDIAIASLTHTPARAIHLLISGANVDLHATHLTLPQGVVGISGPRGLPSAWHEDVQLGHQQAITAISAVAPTHGPCTLHVAVANPGIALDLLIHGITVHPQVAYSVAHTATGFDLVGDFTPGTTYQCTLPARWPEAQPTSTLACYPAGASLQVPIPARQSGFWPIGTGLLEGQLQIGARGANHATVAISRMDTPTDSTLLSTTPLSWTVDPDHKEGMVQLDCDALLAGLADGKYVMCVHAATTQPMEDLAIPIQITHHGVRPLRTIRSLGTWIERGCTGDVMIRIASLDSDR